MSSDWHKDFHQSKQKRDKELQALSAQHERENALLKRTYDQILRNAEKANGRIVQDKQNKLSKLKERCETLKNEIATLTLDFNQRMVGMKDNQKRQLEHMKLQHATTD